MAQKRAMNWYFGNYVGLNFSSNGTASTLSNGSQTATEACASISDLNGNLLFYTNGDSVFTHTGGLMSNGANILGNHSATQGALIIPQPGVKNIYYLFTIDDTSSNLFNLNYSIIDMSLNNGEGAVTSTKNVHLLTGVSERLAATYNNTGSGVWVMVRDGDAAKFHAFSLTSSGINNTPVSSSVGSSTSISWAVQSGQMKFSPDGSYLAWACRSGNFVELLRFNKDDGTLDTWSRKINFPNSIWPYGVEFSSDVSRFYVSCAQAGIYQYNMSYVVNQTLFEDSEVPITSSGTYRAYGMQLAPNGKIYCASFWDGVHVINSPNSNFDQVDFQTSAHTYSGGKYCNEGLPSFLSNYFVDKRVVTSDTCFGDSTSFSYLLELGDSVLWNFGDHGSSNNTSTLSAPKHRFSSIGNYEVSLIIYNSDGADTVVSSISINGLPTFTLGSDTTICFGTQYLLNPGLSNAYYHWQDGKNTPVYAVRESGVYSVRVQQLGCFAYDTVTVQVDKPSVTIVSNTASPCENKNAFNFSISQNDRVSSIAWNFGDGTMSTAGQTTHSYQAEGSYDIILETINENGCKAKATKEIEVLPVVSASMKVNKVEQCFANHQFAVSFPDSANSNLKTYFFEFSDGRRVLNSSASQVFNTAGDKSVSLITISNDGCKDTVTKVLKVYSDPILKYTLDSTANCFASHVILVKDLSTSVNGSIGIRSYSSEGMSFTGNQAVFKYAAPGDYVIQSVIEDNKGCKVSEAIQVHIHPNPVANFDIEGGNCIGTKSIQLTNNTSISSGKVNSYSWDFGDGSSSTNYEPMKQYGQADRYSITLTAVSNNGCTNSFSKEVVTYEVPEAKITTSYFEPCLNESRLDLLNASVAFGDDVLSYEWTVDGKSYTSENLTDIRFSTPGPKLVSMKVTSDKGCYDELQTTFMVLPSPEVSYTINETAQCEENNSFIAISTSENSDSPIASTRWTLDDGRVFDGGVANFSFQDHGTYTLNLRLVNRLGCAAELKSELTVHPQPNASFDAQDVCQSNPMQFNNTSTIALGSIDSSWWNFGDKQTSNMNNPSHQYGEAGEYAVYLQVKSDQGCQNFVMDKVTVLEGPYAEYTYQKHGYKKGIEETVYRFESLEQSSLAKVLWYVDGIEKSTGRVAFIGFTDTGRHDVTMVVETGAGCPGTSSKNIFVAPPFELYVPTGFTPNGDGKNDVLLPRGDNYISEYEMVIVNRWGTVMFKTTSPTEGWDGKFKGNIAQPGTYVYLIRVVDIEGVEWRYEGTVVLLQ